MIVPDLSGYEFEKQILSTISRLIILWFSKIEYANGRWKQIQITLINARMTKATFEITNVMPSLKAYKLFETATERSKKMELRFYFANGELWFECENISCVEYDRAVIISRSA